MLLFLDVDGPLIPFGGPGPYPVHGARAGIDPSPHPLLTRLAPSLGPRLLALGCELVWATTWLDDANAVVAPWLGLPPLPVVDWPETPTRAGLHWKTQALAAWADGRPFVWLDDEITPTDAAWVAAHHPAPALLHRVDHRYGLTDTDFAALEAWLDRPLPYTSTHTA
ncbi:HAD domain-containing protein [Streptomyces sp. NPDC051315]|uniref:HAD domain-containing protein n=1 Tax=Streptomyces sp. NPDC051315 TaxID=3365650 RepID=UPI00379BC7D1